MTPEERAIKVWLGINLKTDHADDICGAIADAIRQAVAAEREECAKVADEHAWPEFMQGDLSPHQEGMTSAAIDIAKAIRARGKT